MDTAFPHPSVFVKLVKKANLAHCRHTFNLSRQAEDKHIYQIAFETDRIVITMDEDFNRIVRNQRAGVFLLPSGLSNTKIDALITKFIRGKNPTDFSGKVTRLKYPSE
ncbi:MAG: DUF5615 family PIN-like protein [Patescibacteria group bacterium]